MGLSSRDAGAGATTPLVHAGRWDIEVPGNTRLEDCNAWLELRRALQTRALATLMAPPREPAYQRLGRSGKLKERARRARERLAECDLCARYCRVDRRRGTEGAVCRTGERAVVHSFGPHHGEEDPLRGWRGSGTIFFSHCNLRCSFCQNWEISHAGVGRAVEAEELAEMMLTLQAEGCHNINLVSPSHVVAQILEAVAIAAERGLSIPLVYNTGGFDSPEALELLDGVVDIYMPDIKYGTPEVGRRLSRVRDYVEANRRAVKEMHRQVGDLEVDASGIARRGLLVRHLVMPGLLSETDKVLAFIARELSPNTYLNLMDQYRPCYRAAETPPVDRPLSREEYREALALAERYGLRRLDRPRARF